MPVKSIEESFIINCVMGAIKRLREFIRKELKTSAIAAFLFKR